MQTISGPRFARLFLAQLFTALAVCLLAGCGKSEAPTTSTAATPAAPGKVKTVGVAFETLQTEYWIAGFEAIKAELKKRDRESMDTIAGLTSANATLSAEIASMAEDLEAEVNVWENSLPFFLCHFAIFLNFMFAIFATALADPPFSAEARPKA